MTKKKEKEKNWVCYCLCDKTRGYSYVGITNNFTRRHRQHNGELVGGAKYTRAHRPWSTLFKLHGLQTHQQVLQFEWAMKHRRKRGHKGVVGRIRTLESLLSVKTRWTKRAPKICSLSLVVEVFLTEERYLKYAGIKSLPIRAKKNITYLFLKK